MKIYLFVSLYMLIAKVAIANVGVFTGNAHTIELASTDQIQMVKEEVTIIPGRGRFHFTGSVPGMDRVEYDCKFKLKNISGRATTIQVGFPLNSQFLSPPYSRTQKVEDLVTRYRFIVQEGEKIHSLRYTSADSEKKLKNLFLWDLSFKKGETKDIRVSYSMPISMTLASSSKGNSSKAYTQEWTNGLEKCMLEHFGYVTQTGKSWAGPIGEATFRIYTKGFDDYLLARPLIEGVTEDKKEEYLNNVPVWRPVICRVMVPSDWKMTEQGFWERTIKNYKAEKNLSFRYYILSLPQTIEDVKKMISKNGLDAVGRKDLADILLEFNGVKTGNKRIEDYLSNQVWYGQTPLRKIPEDVIQSISK